MSNNSNQKGRAYEYACIQALYNEIKKIRAVAIESNKPLEMCEQAWNTLTPAEQNIYTLGALTGIRRIFELEPRILQDDGDNVTLLIQPDRVGETGDVRDLLVIRSSIAWEIGFSLKHNNFAVKHSRLASHLDFGKSWFDIKCSAKYWDAIQPVFTFLSECKDRKIKFSELQDKEEKIYLPVLKAFMQEVTNIFSKSPEAPAKLVEYLLGRYDFYKIINVDGARYTTLQGVNIHDTLGKPAGNIKSLYEVPVVKLPKRLIHIGLVPHSNTTVELYLDAGWQFTFRIHNASTYVEPSLKFDIKLIGMPTSVFTLNCRWS